MLSPRTVGGGGKPGWGMGQGLSATQTRSNTGWRGRRSGHVAQGSAGAQGVASLCAPPATETPRPLSPQGFQRLRGGAV